MNTYLKNCTINMHVFLSDEVLRLNPNIIPKFTVK